LSLDLRAGTITAAAIGISKRLKPAGKQPMTTWTCKASGKASIDTHPIRLAVNRLYNPLNQ